MAHKSSIPKKVNISTLVIYGVIAVILLVLCVMLGAAMDLAVKPDGKLDIALIGGGFEKIIGKPYQIVKALQTKGSYAPKMLLFGLFAIGIFALYKYSESGKRLHRKGVEHGSAKWGNKREMKELADPAKYKFKPFLTTDGKRIFDQKGNFTGAHIDNNIILSEEVRLSLNTRKHGLNLNCLVMGGSGSGKTRSIVEPNIMQLNTSFVITDPQH